MIQDDLAHAFNIEVIACHALFPLVPRDEFILHEHQVSKRRSDHVGADLIARVISKCFSASTFILDGQFST
jgi:hypothetical protein